jgi:multiple sugar transport system substrate-binding protein
VVQQRPQAGFRSSLLTAPVTRRSFLSLSAAGMAALGLSACSSPFDTEENLTFTFWGGGPEKDAVTNVIQSFSKGAGLTPNAQNIAYEEYDTKLNTLLAGSNTPDAGYLTEGMAMRLGEQGRLTNVLENDTFLEFMPNAIHYYKPGEAVGQTALEAYALWYDQDLFDELGIVAPATAADVWDWDTFIATAIKLTSDSEGRNPSESGFDPDSITRYGTVAPSDIGLLLPLFRSNGLEIFNEAGTETYIGSDAAIEVLQAVSDLIFEHRVSPNTAQQQEIGGGAALQLANGRVGMAFDGQWALLDLNQQEGLNYNAAVLPSFGDGAWTLTLGGANAVFGDSNNKDDALELLLALADPEQVPLYSNGLWMPMQEKYYTDEALAASWMDNDAHPSNYRTAVADMAMNNALSIPAYRLKNWSEIADAFSGALTPMFTEKTDIPAAAKALAEIVNPLMEGAFQDSAD